MRGADQPPASAAPVFKQYCFKRRGNGVATAGVSLENLTAIASVADTCQICESVVAALDQKRMPPKGLPQPTDEQRNQAVAWIHSQLNSSVKAHAGDPGRSEVAMPYAIYSRKNT